MNKTKHLGIGLAGLVAGLAMVAFAFAAGTGGNAQAQTPGATGTAVTTGSSVSGAGHADERADAVGVGYARGREQPADDGYGPERQ